MRRIAATVAFCCAMALAGAAQASGTVKSSLSIDLGSFLLGSMDAKFETALSPRGALVLDGSFLTVPVGSRTLRGGGGAIGYRLYPRGRAPAGFWLGGEAGGVAMADMDGGPDRLRVYGMELAGQAGHKWVTETGFVANLSVELAGFRGVARAGDESVPLSDFAPGIGLELGYAW